MLASDLEVVLDPVFDTVGFQPETVQFYEDKGSLASIFDTGASVVTFSALDQLLFDPLENDTGIQIKVAGGAEAEGIGGVLTGDVSQPGTVLVDGIHANIFSGDIFDSGTHFDHIQGRGSVATADNGSQFQGDPTLNAEDGIYNGFSLLFTSGANTGQSRVIADYSGATREFSIASPFPNVPAAGDTFHIAVGQGVVGGTLPSRVRLSATPGPLGLSGVSNEYVGRYLLFTSGELEGDYQLITDYDGSTHTFEFALPFSTRPAVGDSFDIVVGTGSSAITPGVQTFVGTFEGSEILPTIAGTPMLNPTDLPSDPNIVQPLHPDGLALEVGPQELLLDLGELLADFDETLGDLFAGITLPIPSVQFRPPGSTLEKTEAFFAESTVVDTPSATAMEFAGTEDLPFDPENPESFQDFFNGFHLRFLTGDLAGEIQQVSGYDAATRTFTFGADPAEHFSAAPAIGDVFELVRVSSDPLTVGLDFVGFDNHLDPGDTMTVSHNPVSNEVMIAHGGNSLDNQTFLFDTGAQLSTITTEEAAFLGFDLTAPEFTISVQGAAGVVQNLPGFTMDELSLPTLDGGTLTFSDVPVFVIDVAEEIQGIMGMNLFNSGAEFLYDPFDPNHDQPTLQMTFYNQRSEVAPEEIDTSELDALGLALLDSLADVMPLAFGDAVGLREIALPNFGVGVDLDLTPQEGIVTEEDGVPVFTVAPGSAVTFDAEVRYAAETYQSFQLDFANSDNSLELDGWDLHQDWDTQGADENLEFPGDSFVSASSSQNFLSNRSLGTFVLTAPTIEGDYLLTAESSGTQVTHPDLTDPLAIRDFGDIIIRVQEAPSLSISDAALVEGDSGSTNLEFTVTLAGAATAPIAVDFATADAAGNDAADGEDYTSLSGTLQFAPGEFQKTISVAISGDATPEGDEQFVVNLSNARYLPIELTPVSDVTGVDDDGDISDPTPFDRLESATAQELRTDAGPPKRAFAMEFDVGAVSTGATISSATLTFAETTDAVDPAFLLAGVYGYTGDADGVATLAHPFNTLLSNQVGSVGNQTVDVETVDVTSFIQSLRNSGETYAGFYVESGIDPYYIHSGEATNAANRPLLEIEYGAGTAAVDIADPQALGVIRNDDTVISVSDGEWTEKDSGHTEAAFVVQLSHPSALDLTIDYSTSDGTASAGNDYEAADGSVTFAAGETAKGIPVRIFGDTLFEPDETFFVNLSTAGSANVDQGSGTIQNDDNHAPTDIALAPDSIAEDTDTSGGDVLIGNLLTTDLDAGDTHTYTLVAGTGDADNDSFTISGNELKVKQNTVLDHEMQESYSVRVRSTDAGGLDVKEPLIITVTNVDDETPVVMSSSAVLNSLTLKFSDNELSATDVDSDDALLEFTLKSLPSHGQLSNGASVLSVDDKFTQQDIADANVSYTHDGSNTLSDSFTFTVKDPVGNETEIQTFSFDCGRTVTHTGDSGPGSLRFAILCANAELGVQTIDFNIDGSGPHTIQPGSALPTITDAVVIDGTTEPDFNETPVVEVDGSAAGADKNGLTIIAGGGGSTIRGLAVNRFGGHGLVLAGSDGNTIAGNHIGTDPTGTIARANGKAGIFVFNSDNNLIGSTMAGAGNLISGNTQQGVRISSSSTGNTIQGNLIGTNKDGTDPLGNLHGISIINAPSNVIGGTNSEAGNVISGNDRFGVQITGSSATGNRIEGNLIGADMTGSGDLGNGFQGVVIATNAGSNTLGGTADGAGNVISGNDKNGIFLRGATGNLIQGNLIGTNLSGDIGLGNSLQGIAIAGGADGHRIGGTADGAGNVISANGGHGMRISGGSTGIVVQGNLIGTDVNGTSGLGNNLNGITIINATSTQIGGTTTAAGNVISDNRRGVLIRLGGSTGNVIEGNRIGTDVNGSALGNNFDGVRITEGASSNTIGGTTAGATNVIANNGTVANGAPGVALLGGTGNAIRRNSMFGNAGLGVDLNDNGVTANDTNDPDTGANNLQNFPDISSAVLNNGDVEITYSVSSVTPNSTFPLTVEFYLTDAGERQGRTLLGSDTYTEGTAPTATFAADGALAGDRIVGTATDSEGNTSEFSLSATITDGSSLLALLGEAAIASSEVLTTADVDPLLDQAIAGWIAAGISDSQIGRLENLQVGIADLSGARLGEQFGNTILLDINAAGYGWFIDPTPSDDSEFFSRTQPSTLDSQHHVDLLTVIYHEMGHALGLEDDYSDPNSDDIMNGWLGTGTRREPTADDLDSLFADDLALDEALA